MEAKLTTLCYLQQQDEWLMLNRNKKAKDDNWGKWIGVGGKFLPKESPEECMRREVREETGFLVTKWAFRGIVTFVSDCCPVEYMHLFTVSQWQGEQQDCTEGELKWVKEKDLFSLSLWEGDKIFLRLLRENHPFFSLKLVYQGDALQEAALDGFPLAIKKKEK